MSIVILECCCKHIDLDYDSEDAIYVPELNAYFCYDHLLARVIDQQELSEDEAEALIEAKYF